MAEDPKILRARELAKNFLALMSEKEQREFRRIAKTIATESDDKEEEAAAEEVDAEIAKALPPVVVPKREEETGGTWVDREHGPFTELVQSVFGTRFVPMGILRDATGAHLDGGVTVTIERPGFLRLSKPTLPALAAGPPQNGVYAVWYDDRNESMLVRLDDWLTFGRHLYTAGRKAGIEMSAKARERYGSRGIARASRIAGPTRWEWRWIDYQLLGNARDGFEVNDAIQTNITVELDEGATNQDILREARKEILEAGANTKTVLLEHVEEDIIEFVRKKGHEPLGRLTREKKVVDA